MTEDPKRWSQPFAALLGAYDVQLGLGLPSIGGKDSMSGTFQDIDVPPTLVSFAVDVAHDHEIITPELKKAGNKLVWLRMEQDHYELPVYASLKDQYANLQKISTVARLFLPMRWTDTELQQPVSKMSLEWHGCKLEETIDKRELFAPAFGI